MSTRGTKRKLQEDENQEEERKTKKTKQKGKPSRKRKHEETTGEGKGEKKQKTDNWPTVDELLARWHSNQSRKREDIHGYKTTTAEYHGPGYYWQYNRDLPEDHPDYKRWIDPERRLVDCKLPQRHANKWSFELVMGVGTAFSRKFCMDVFMYFTPRERLTMLMKFWRVWRDHFKNEKLPWRWIEYEANRRSRFCDQNLYYPDDNLYSYMTNLQDDTSLMDKAFGTVVLADQHNRYLKWSRHPEAIVEAATRFVFYADCLNEKHTRDDGSECSACIIKAARGK